MSTHRVGTPSTYDVLLGGEPLGEVVAPVEISRRCCTACRPPSTWPAPTSSSPRLVAREHRLRAGDRRPTCARPAPTLDYIFIDCPPSLGLLTLNALVAAREVLIPIQCEYYALEGLAQLLNTVELVTRTPESALGGHDRSAHDVRRRTRLADRSPTRFASHFGALVLGPVIPRNVRVSEAPGFGQTVITYDPGSRGAVELPAGRPRDGRSRCGAGTASDDVRVRQAAE